MSNNLEGITKEELYHLYYEENLSQWQIADKFNVTQGAIFYWMRKFGIKARSHDDSLILFGKRGRFTGEKNPKWSGGRHINPGGYVHIRMPDYPRATSRGYVLEHIYVYEQEHGPLSKGWEVHHLNGIKTDNRIENLVAMEGHKHKDYIPTLKRRINQLEEKIKELENELINLKSRS